MSFLVFAPLAFVVLWLGLRWPLRRALLIAVLIGVVADVVFDFIVTRPR